MGYGEHHVASPEGEGRYGSVHSTTSENENTGSGIKDVRVLCSLLVLFRAHLLGRRSPLSYSRLGFSTGDCARPCGRNKGKQVTQLVVTYMGKNVATLPDLLLILLIWARKGR
jgi:hypothetical protein